MSSSVIKPDRVDWITRPHAEGALAGFADVRANLWRYEPGAKGRRHRHPVQEETFVVLSGTLSMYVPLQSVNHGDADLLVYAYDYPPESEHADLLPSAV
jgi:hypothetical protein